MKKYLLAVLAALLIGAFCAACTPGAIVDTINSIGGTPGNAYFYSTSGNAPYVATPGNAG